MDERKNEWMKERMDGWMKEWMDEWKNEWINKKWMDNNDNNEWMGESEWLNE